MTKNPVINAFSATAYIALVVLFMNYADGSKLENGNRIFGPIAVISLISLSAAMMVFIFLFQPFQLYFNNKKKQAIKLVLQTLVCFAGITITLLALLTSGVVSFK